MIKPGSVSRWLNNVLWEVITVLTIYIDYEFIFYAASMALPNALKEAIRKLDHGNIFTMSGHSAEGLHEYSRPNQVNPRFDTI
jgi:hypothetical protein